MVQMEPKISLGLDLKQQRNPLLALVLKVDDFSSLR